MKLCMRVNEEDVKECGRYPADVQQKKDSGFIVR